MKRHLCFILIVLFAVACEEPVDWRLDDPVTPRLVVEGMLTNRPGMNYVKLSLPVKDPNSTPQAVSGALVVITDGEDYIILEEKPGEPGIYITEPDVRAVVNKIYGLFIRVGEYEFAAGAYMVPVSPLKTLFFFEDPASPGNYRIFSAESDTPSYTEYLVEWQESGGQTGRSVFYSYKLSTIDVSQLFKPGTEKLSFPAGSRVIRRKYSLSPEHERYIRSLLLETDWRGGWFDVMHGNLQTNLNNGAVGFFAASSVVIDTTFIE